MEDADDLKLNALKKAYAEVLLNVSKEAAARVLASEKRGLRLQQELSSAKEEGFQLLLRLNQMFDAKKIETETVSLNQRRRIEELEAQLEEAEGIYTALRKDLRKAQSALSKSGTNISEPSRRNSTSIGGPFPGEISSLQSRDFSIVVKTQKQPELYKSECTQRIRAFEGNQLSLSGRDDGEEDDNVEEEACLSGVAPMDKDLDLISSKSDKTQDLFEVKVLDANCNVFPSEAFGSFQIKRKRTNRYKKHTNLWSSINSVEREAPHGNCEEMIKPSTSKVEMGSRRSDLLIESESVVQEKLPVDTVTSDMEVVHRQICEDKFKYTFQRRRKKKQQQRICADENFSAEEVLKIETDEQHDRSQEPEIVADLTSSESSRHSMQQLVEVV